MIVAAGAGHGKAHDTAGRDVDTICNDKVVLPALVATPNSEEAEGCQFLAW